MAVFRVVTVDSDDEVAYPAARDLLKILTSGTIGAAIPAYTGQTAVNTTNGLLYRATGTDAGDWEPHSTLRTLGALTEVSLYEGEVIKFSSTYYLSTATGTDDWQLLIGGAATWGTITGTLSAQTDLQTALDAKLNLTGGTLTGPLTITGGTVTNSTPLLVMTQTWNDGTDVFKFDTKAVTNTASKAYSSAWADVSTVNEILVDGVARFAFIPKGSENCPMLALGRENDVLLKAAAYAFIVRSEATSDMVALGWCNSAPGVTVAQTGRIGFNQSNSFLGGGNAEPTAFFKSPGAAIIQMGSNHATTPTHQTFKAHDVTTGAGADLILQGGAGSANDGYVKIGTATGGLAFLGAAGSPLILGNINTNISSGGVGSALLDDTQSDGGLGGGAYTFGGLVAALKSYGIIG